MASVNWDIGTLISTPGMQEKECFAKCSSATINNPASLSVIKRHFSNTYKKYLELVK